MKTNLDTIQEVVEYIDVHLEERLDLDSLCKVAGYSKYHLGRLPDTKRNNPLLLDLSHCSNAVHRLFEISRPTTSF